MYVALTTRAVRICMESCFGVLVLLVTRFINRHNRRPMPSCLLMSISNTFIAMLQLPETDFLSVTTPFPFKHTRTCHWFHAWQSPACSPPGTTAGSHADDANRHSRFCHVQSAYQKHHSTVKIHSDLAGSVDRGDVGAIVLLTGSFVSLRPSNTSWCLPKTFWCHRSSFSVVPGTPVRQNSNRSCSSSVAQRRHCRKTRFWVLDRSSFTRRTSMMSSLAMHFNVTAMLTTHRRTGLSAWPSQAQSSP